jgi:pimeloyl-ACP methyl ester carboxylesterase
MPVVARGAIVMRDENYLPLYQNLTAPIWLVHAAEDQIVLSAASEQLQAIRPDVRYTRYATGGHAPHWEYWEQFNQELLEFAHQAVQKA